MLTTIAGSKLWSLKLFQTDLDVYWVQVNLEVSLGYYRLDVIMLSITKKYSYSSSKEEVIAAMENNRGSIGLVQTKCT